TSYRIIRKHAGGERSSLLYRGIRQEPEGGPPGIGSTPRRASAREVLTEAGAGLSRTFLLLSSATRRSDLRMRRLSRRTPSWVHGEYALPRKLYRAGNPTASRPIC